MVDCATARQVGVGGEPADDLLREGGSLEGLPHLLVEDVVNLRHVVIALSVGDGIAVGHLKRESSLSISCSTPIYATYLHHILLVDT